MLLNFDIENFIKMLESNCSKVTKKTFHKNDIITNYIQKRNQLCILIEGSADLVRYDINGNKSIIEHFSKHDVFGETFYNVSINNELFVECKKKSTVLFYNYDDLYTTCKPDCNFHLELSQEIPKLVLRKIISLNTRIELLTKRSTRDKLLGYFNMISAKKHSNKFILKYSLTDLADYLNVDRSAMMRELKLLKDDGLVDKIGNTIILLYR